MIEFRNVSYKYENAAADALHQVNFTVPQGQFLAVVGHNGSGKSTLSKHINGLLQPYEGQVLVDGMDTCKEESLLDIRRRVGMVFQNPDNQLVTTIVEEDVAFGPENLGMEPSLIRRRVDEALAAVGMSRYAQSAAHRLSGGQKQRVAIAGMLAMEPEILVLDEATAMLDPQGRRELLDTVGELHREKGITVVVITQYMGEAVRADRMLVLNRGQILRDAAPREIFKEGPFLRSLGLDVPAAVELRDALRLNGKALSDEALTVEEVADELCRLW